MKKKNITGLSLGFILFTTGLFIGLAFSSLAAWAHLEGMAFWGYPESISFDSNLTREAELTRLQCPILLTDGEIGTVRLQINNPNETPTRIWVKSHISMPGRLENMLRRTRSRYLEPGGESEIRWQVSTENTIHNHMILVRVFQQRTEHHPPNQTRHCGIVSANLWGLSSSQILTGTVISTIALLGSGIYTWFRFSSEKMRESNRVLKVMGAIGTLAVIALAGSLLRVWQIGFPALILIPIIIISFVSYHLGRLQL